jgi:hypothetical protein
MLALLDFGCILLKPQVRHTAVLLRKSSHSGAAKLRPLDTHIGVGDEKCVGALACMRRIVAPEAHARKAVGAGVACAGIESASPLGGTCAERELQAAQEIDRNTKHW